MKRRQVLKSIVVVSSGLIIFPACKGNQPPIPVYGNLSIDRSQFELIQNLAEAILPKNGLEITNPEPVNEFILTMVNDCYTLDQCKKYVAGLKAFQGLVEEKHKNDFSKIGAEKQLEVFNYLKDLEAPEEPEEAAKFFFDTTHRLTIQHFTGSEYFLTQHLEWKFVPGPYEGCVAVSD